MDHRAVITVAETVAGNIRTYRQIRGLEQDALARRMQSLGFAWRRPTVSEAERNQRNVTVAELLALALALETTVDRLVDTRGPEGLRGPKLVLSEQAQSSGMVRVGEDDDPVDRRVLATAIQPENVTALVCSHATYAYPIWDDPQGLQDLNFIPVGQS